MRHDGSTCLSEADLARHLSTSLGAVITLIESPQGAQISIQLTAVPGIGVTAHLDERLPQPS